MVIFKTARKCLLFMILFMFFVFLNACALRSSVKRFDDFMIVTSGSSDDLSTLAAKYLNDPGKGWIIAEFNNINSVSRGQQVIIPLKPLQKGGLTPTGYQTIPVLVYHRFAEEKVNKMTVPRNTFEEQMRYLKLNGYNVLSLEQLFDF